MREYILNIQSIYPEYGQITGSVSIASVTSLGQPQAFDIFLLNNISDMTCYKSMMITQNFAANCSFLSDPSKTLLNQTLFSVDYLYSNFSQTGAQFAYFIVDNTPFPPNGALPQGNLTLQTVYSAYVEPSKNYLKLVLTLGITLGCLIILSIACVLFCLYRYKRVRADYLSYKSYSSRRNNNNNNRSFVSSGSIAESSKRSPYSSQIRTSKSKLI